MVTTSRTEATRRYLMIEPAIAAAIVAASGTLIGKLLELAGKREPSAKAREVVDKTYDQLSKHAVTTNCVRILVASSTARLMRVASFFALVMKLARDRWRPRVKPVQRSRAALS